MPDYLVGLVSQCRPYVKNIGKRWLVQGVRCGKRRKKQGVGGFGGCKCSITAGSVREPEQGIDTLVNELFGIGSRLDGVVAVIERFDFDPVAASAIF